MPMWTTHLLATPSSAAFWNPKVTTVSYTHLDVYKRQVKEIAYYDGDISEFLAPEIAECVREKMSERKKNG